MDEFYQQIRSGSTFPIQSLEELIESGFVIIPGPIIGNALDDLCLAYDAVMSAAYGPDFKVGSTTNRMADLLNHGSAFDAIYVFTPLLEACGHIIGEPFKLSSLLARTLRAGTPSQELHTDLASAPADAPLLGFILMIDPFRVDSGATRFVPGSHNWTTLPDARLSDTRARFTGEMVGCGERGTMIIFNGAIWHGHGANVSRHDRRSVQGYFVRRNARSGFDFRQRLLPVVRARMNPLAHYLLALDDKT